MFLARRLPFAWFRCRFARVLMGDGGLLLPIILDSFCRSRSNPDRNELSILVGVEGPVRPVIDEIE